jgi:hypothetical protein
MCLYLLDPGADDVEGKGDGVGEEADMGIFTEDGLDGFVAGFLKIFLQCAVGLRGIDRTSSRG